MYHDGLADPFSIEPEVVVNPDSIQVLVNKFYTLTQDWAPNDLVEITSNNERLNIISKYVKQQKMVLSFVSYLHIKKKNINNHSLICIMRRINYMH